MAREWSRTCERKFFLFCFYNKGEEIVSLYLYLYLSPSAKAATILLQLFFSEAKIAFSKVCKLAPLLQWALNNCEKYQYTHCAIHECAREIIVIYFFLLSSCNFPFYFFICNYLLTFLDDDTWGNEFSLSFYLFNLILTRKFICFCCFTCNESSKSLDFK